MNMYQKSHMGVYVDDSIFWDLGFRIVVDSIVELIFVNF